jgi:hypothetical protein
VVKLDQKILRLPGYLVLVGFLSVTISNAVHYHKLDIGNKNSSLSSHNHKNNNHLFINGSESFCLIHFAYNSLNSTTASFDNPFLEYEKNPEYFGSFLVTSKPIKECINHYNRRAPPILFFS